MKLKFKKEAENYEHVQRIFRDNNFMPYAGVEVGVRLGEFAKFILSNNHGLTMLLVDPYLPYHDVGKDYTQEEQNELKDKALLNLSPFLGRIELVYKPSLKAASQFASFAEFSFVFVDAEHTESACYADLNAWAPLIRSEGLLMGHDYSMDGVGKAVRLWMKENNYPKEDLLHTGPETDVWAIKLR